MKLVRTLALAGCLVAAAARGQTHVMLTLSNAPGFAIPADFAGLSFGAVAELPGHGGVSGHLFSPTNSQLITLFKNSGLHHLRLGGSTVEGTNAAAPDHAAIDSVFGFAQAAGIKVMYSLPVLNGNAESNAATADYIWRRYRPLLDCFALGNEPDIRRYHYPPFGSGSDPAITNYSSYLAVWKKFAAAVTNVAPGAGFAGPDAANRSWARLFARDEGDSGIISVVTQHFYVGGSPFLEGGQEKIPSAEAISNMLSVNWVSRKYPALYQEAIVPVAERSLRWRLTESDDYLKGVDQASDSFASALWALDYLHWWAAHGCSGVNFHNTEWLKTDTVYLHSPGRYEIHPKAYGIKAFELGSRGRVEPVAKTDTNRLNLTAYAVGDGAAHYLTLINKEHGLGARTADVTIAPAGFAISHASTMFLSAPNGEAGALDGMTLGGSTITNNAPWEGTCSPLASVESGGCHVTVPAATAVIVRLEATRKN